MHDWTMTGLQPRELIAPAITGLIFILIMSLIREPPKQRFNAILVAGAGSVYLNGGFGALEFVFIVIITALAYKGLSYYRYIGIAWLLHTVWDILHHLYGTPIWIWMESSSAGCAVFDTIIGLWFLLGAPSVIRNPLTRRIS